MRASVRRLATIAAVAVMACDVLVAQQVTMPIAAHRASAQTPFTPAGGLPKANGFARSGFAQFMSSPAGRVLRVVAGAGMIAGGIKLRDDGHRNGGTALAVVGLVPLTAGAFDFCVISPLFGGPFLGRDIRAAGK
jgi:hypothetical protein